MSNNYAENHDLEKLMRWRNDLSKEPANHFPVHAVFLVSSEDRLWPTTYSAASAAASSHSTPGFGTLPYSDNMACPPPRAVCCGSSA